MFQENKTRQTFQKNEHFLPPDTHTYVRGFWYGKTRVLSSEFRVESLKARVEIQKYELKFASTSYEFESTSPRIIKLLNH